MIVFKSKPCSISFERTGLKSVHRPGFLLSIVNSLFDILTFIVEKLWFYGRSQQFICNKGLSVEHLLVLQLLAGR